MDVHSTTVTLLLLILQQLQLIKHIQTKTKPHLHWLTKFIKYLPSRT